MIDPKILDLLAQLVSLVACAVILWRTEPAINLMHRKTTPLLLRLSFWLISIGAFAAILAMLDGAVPPWPAAIGAAGVALLLICERRIRYLARHPRVFP